MADIAPAFRSWSVTAGSNAPTVNTVVGAGLAPNLQQIQATVRQYLASIGTSVVSGATTDLSTVDGYTIPLSGNSTITSFGTEQAGIGYRLQFSGTPTLKNSTAIQTPGSVDMSITAGDIVEAFSLGAGNWKVANSQTQIQRLTSLLANSINTSALTVTGSENVTGSLNASAITINPAAQAILTLGNSGSNTGATTKLLGWASVNKNWQITTGSGAGAGLEFYVSSVAGGSTFAANPTLTFDENGGIKFPATQLASSDANTLDDYEEGTWTPSVGGNATYTTQAGRYTKVGRLVHVRAQIAINSIGTGSTTQVSGFPFAAGVDSILPVSNFAALATSVVFITFLLNSGTTTAQVQTLTAAAVAVTNGNPVFANSAQLVIEGCYEV